MQALHTILPLSFTSGINLYLTVLAVGLSIRFGWVSDAPPGLQPLASTPVLITTAVLYVLEFFADKIQFVDNIWDIGHTFVRPAGAAILAVASVSGLIDPRLEIIAGLLAGMVALTSHSGKAGTRTAINMASPMENLTNVIVSLLEDALVALLVVIALMYPTIANIVTVLLLVLIAILVPPALRWSWFTLQAVGARLRALVRQIDQSEALPAEHAALLEQPPAISSRCQVQNLRGATGARGFLSLAGQSLCFTYSRRGEHHAWCLPTDQVNAVFIRERFLVIMLELLYHDEQRQRRLRFAFTRDRMPLVQQLVEQFHATRQHHETAD